ncbi:polar amino acid ABC transporter permease [Hydrogenophaga crassostreae]|uniref:Polar amino acid ABC transporter permease n=1 Tax=Hydrogenophaga crassostreae TaxID=1763535 RepID=A0A162PAM8_9BURK|nr:amino acid ABC transporter permease [Hydrogenophaga crassostreae]AOW14718.1 polar amino acid ABC transporter permease [Hydrogenophaga crassostreae]OAD43185.1 polar amino acid ABC transporter permease [Hydrogenophaga crassostreae]
MLIELDFPAVLAQWPILAKGVAWTLGLTAVSTAIGLVIGTLCAWARSGKPIWLQWLVGAYVELVRNTPFIVQLFFVFFGLPAMGVKLTPELASVIAMVINLGAYSAEIIRAGIEATPKGQFEAAASLALSKVQTFVHVVLPPALKKVWPALTSQIIIVMLGSAVCGQISTEELSFAANLIQSRNFRAFEAFIIATGIYLVLSIGVRGLLNWAGPRYLFGGRRG